MIKPQMLLIALLWLGIFLDVLEGFTLKSTIGVALTTSRSATLSSDNVVGTDFTLVLPPVIEDQEDYPSPLHKIHVRTLMSEEEAGKCSTIAHEYAKSTGSWETPDSDRHQSYATCDFPVEDCHALDGFLADIDFDGRLWENLSELYGIEYEDMSYLDLFVAHYQAKDSDESQVMDRLEAHRDGTLLAFSLLLSSPDEFEGGGTFYDALRDVPPSGILHAGGTIRPDRAGDSVLHCGKVLHGADVVTSGARTVLVGFIEVSERCQQPGVLAGACVDFGRMDVAAYRYRRQAKKKHKGWVLNPDRWVQGHSHVRGYAPAFGSVIRRADPEYQRQKKLEAEDVLLRSILRPEDERPEVFRNEEITILPGYEE
jgi:hypothetical protein